MWKIAMNCWHTLNETVWIYECIKVTNCGKFRIVNPIVVMIIRSVYLDYYGFFLMCQDGFRLFHCCRFFRHWLRSHKHNIMNISKLKDKRKFVENSNGVNENYYRTAINSISVCRMMIFTIVCSFAASSENINIFGRDVNFQRLNIYVETKHNDSETRRKRKWKRREKRDWNKRRCISAMHFHWNWNIVKLKQTREEFKVLCRMCLWCATFLSVLVFFPPFSLFWMKYFEHRKIKHDWHQPCIHFIHFNFSFLFSSQAFLFYLFDQK